MIDVKTQRLMAYEEQHCLKSYVISTAKNGLGEQIGSGCTPRGWHQVHAIIGLDQPIYRVFVARQALPELYDPSWAKTQPDKDWILSRIIQLDGLEPGLNRGGELDTLSRYIYIHGTSDEASLGHPVSKGCIRMSNSDVIDLAQWVSVGTRVCVQ